MPAPKHSEFYRGFFEQLGEQSSNKAAITLTPDHQNTLLGMLEDYKTQEQELATIRSRDANLAGIINIARAKLKDLRVEQWGRTIEALEKQQCHG